MFLVLRRWDLFGKGTFTANLSLCHFLTQKVTKNLFAEVLFQID
jgi:hypothetical protein